MASIIGLVLIMVMEDIGKAACNWEIQLPGEIALAELHLPGTFLFEENTPLWVFFAGKHVMLMQVV